MKNHPSGPLRPYLEHHPQLGEGVWVDPAATVIGRVQLAEDVSVWPGAVLRGDVASIRVGRASNIQDLCVGHVTHDGPYSPGGRDLEIGQGVTVGHGAILHACTVGDWCLVGMGARLLDNVVLADHCMVAAGALMAPGTETEPGWLWKGSPARPARPLSDDEQRWLHYSAEHYVRLKNQYLAMAAGNSDA